MNEFDLFLRKVEMGPSGPSFIEELTSYAQIVNGYGRMNGHDFSRLSQYDLPKAMAFLISFAVSFSRDNRPSTPEELLGLVDWEKPEDLQTFVDAVTKQGKENPSNLLTKK